MAHSQDDAQVTEHLAGSEEHLVPQTTTAPRGGSNSRALKIAGLTTLVCLLVSSQIFAAYMVFDQKQQIRDLQRTSDKLSKDMIRVSQSRPKTPMRLQMPMNSLLMDFDSNQDPVATKPPQTKPQDTLDSVEKKLMDVMKDMELPQFNDTVLAEMQNLKQHMNETEWKSFETWMRYWLMFQKTHNKPVPPTPQAEFPVIQTKCQIESTSGVGKFGSFKPKCDDQGRYNPVQCWTATGYCWCVDETGAAIKETVSRGKPQCAALGRITPDMMLTPNFDIES